TRQVVTDPAAPRRSHRLGGLRRPGCPHPCVAAARRGAPRTHLCAELRPGRCNRSARQLVRAAARDRQPEQLLPLERARRRGQRRADRGRREPRGSRVALPRGDRGRRHRLRLLYELAKRHADLPGSRRRATAEHDVVPRSPLRVTLGNARCLPEPRWPGWHGLPQRDGEDPAQLAKAQPPGIAADAGALNGTMVAGEVSTRDAELQAEADDGIAPPISVCVICGLAACQGCAPAPQRPISLIVWEDPSQPWWLRLWHTALASSLEPQRFFGELPVGKVGEALAFATCAEVFALSSVAVPVALGLRIVAPELTNQVLSSPAARKILLFT